MKIPLGTEHEVLGSLEVLERTAGYRVLQAAWKSEEDNIVSKIETEEDPNKLLRLAGALRQHRTATTVVSRTIEALRKRTEKK